LAACGGAPQGGAPGEQAGTTAATAPVGETGATEAPAATEVSAGETAATEAPAEDTPAPATGATGGTGTAEPGVLRYALTAEPDTVDPQKTSFSEENQFVMLNYQPLMSFDTQMQPIPGAAESVDVSEDGLTYTFKIRPDSKYSDGSPLTAANFEYAWKRLGDPEVSGEYGNLLCDVVKGYAEYAVTVCPDANGATKTLTEALELDLEALRANVGVTAVDDSTLQIELLQPTPYFLGIAGIWIGAPTREQDVELGEDWWYDPANYVGNGPFMLVEWEHDSRVVWEPNPNYNGPLGPVKLERIVAQIIKEPELRFQAYRNGELDLVALRRQDFAVVDADPQLSQEKYTRAPDATFYLGFNNARPPFDNKAVRQAFSQALDREAWARDAIGPVATPWQSFVPPSIPGYEALQSDQWSFDAEAAQQALADAGYPNGEGLPEIKLTYSQNQTNQQIMEWIASQLQTNLNVQVTLDPVDPTAYTALTKEPETTPQLFLLGWGPDYPDVQNWLSVVFRTGGNAADDISFSNAEFDRLTAEADRETDPERRSELYKQAQDILLEEAPVIFMHYRQPIGLKKPYVKGIETDTTSPLDKFPGFYNLPNITVEP
jgi:oligopeptide transport system substrate-binding protein